jgi:glycosyltransferase involved in cell wall biosynthesis
LLPVCEAQVMPSTFPEAFGMVAVEAAACGVLPLTADHSGMAEVTATLAPALPDELRPLLSFEVGSGAVEEIAAKLVAWLTLDDAARERARSALAKEAALGKRGERRDRSRSGEARRAALSGCECSNFEIGASRVKIPCSLKNFP